MDATLLGLLKRVSTERDTFAAKLTAVADAAALGALVPQYRAELARTVAENAGLAEALQQERRAGQGLRRRLRNALAAIVDQCSPDTTPSSSSARGGRHTEGTAPGTEERRERTTAAASLVAELSPSPVRRLAQQLAAAPPSAAHRHRRQPRPRHDASPRSSGSRRHEPGVTASATLEAVLPVDGSAAYLSSSPSYATSSASATPPPHPDPDPDPAPATAAAAAAVGSGNALVAQIEREISQLDGEIEELKGQLSRAATRRAGSVVEKAIVGR